MRPQDRTRAVLRSRLVAPAKLIAVAIADHMDARGGNCWPSVRRISTLTSLSERTVQHHLAAGVRAGWLTRRGTPGGRHTFEIDFLALEEHDPKETPAAAAPPGRGGPPQQPHPHPRSSCTPTPAAAAPDPTIDPTNDPTMVYPAPSEARDGLPIPPASGEAGPRQGHPSAEAERALDPDPGPPPRHASEQPVLAPAPADAPSGGPPVPRPRVPATPSAGSERDRTVRPRGPPLDPVALVWAAWREHHPAARATPGGPTERIVRRALKEAGGPEALALVVAWAHLAPHERASFLRGADYEAGRSNVGAYLGVESLFRPGKLAERIGWAEEWDRAGRPDWRGAPSPTKAQADAGTPEEGKAWAWVQTALTSTSAFPKADDARLGDGQRRAATAAWSVLLPTRWPKAADRERPFLEREWRQAWRSSTSVPPSSP